MATNAAALLECAMTAPFFRRANSPLYPPSDELRSGEPRGPATVGDTVLALETGTWPSMGFNGTVQSPQAGDLVPTRIKKPDRGDDGSRDTYRNHTECHETPVAHSRVLCQREPATSLSASLLEMLCPTRQPPPLTLTLERRTVRCTMNDTGASLRKSVPLDKSKTATIVAEPEEDFDESQVHRWRPKNAESGGLGKARH
ncbi:hypothetical protein QBC44DRAFT_372379 [Cladorrhinum sp. PSN332]|nr:hypothetical protein QBC44DRAFT_372379 [Cladorrhinum sp. PSN332]